MIPVLYEANKNISGGFLDQGIGALTDAISCLVTEERNGIFELEMTYPIDGKHYKDLVHSNFIKATSRPNGTPQLFRIYEITKPINGIVTVNAEHISYQLAYIPVKPYTASTCQTAISGIKSNLPTGVSCPFYFTTDKTRPEDTKPYEQLVVSNIRERLGGVEGSILDVYGGEWEFNNLTAKLWQNRGSNRGVTLRYGKNITDIEQEENIANTYTGAIGFYASGDGDYVETDVITTAAASNFPFNRIEVVDLSSEFTDGTPYKSEVTEALQAYMAKNQTGVPKVSIKVSFVALWQTEEYKTIAPLENVYLCDTINVQFEKLGISATAKVVKTVHNVLLERYDSLEIGEVRSNLSNRVASQEIKTKEDISGTKTNLEKAIDLATAAINGAYGGHVVIDADANGKPQRILIMDSEDKTQANVVWQYNVAGWGVSKTGINGPYIGAAVLDATKGCIINADYVTTGTMTADRIRGGSLESSDSESNPNFSLNMLTGDLVMKKGSIKLGIPGQGSFWVSGGIASMDSAILSNVYIPGANDCDIQFNDRGLVFYEVDGDQDTDIIGQVTGGTDPDNKTAIVLRSQNGNDVYVYSVNKLRVSGDNEINIISTNGKTYLQGGDTVNITGVNGIYLSGALHPTSDTTGVNQNILTVRNGVKLTLKKGIITTVDTSEAPDSLFTGTLNGIGDSSGNYYCDINVTKGAITGWSGWRHV